jgi:hypothetical protein
MADIEEQYSLDYSGVLFSILAMYVDNIIERVVY